MSNNYQFACRQCGVDFLRPDPEPADDLCDACRLKRDAADGLQYLINLAEEAQRQTWRGDTRGRRETLAKLAREAAGLERFLR